MDRDFEIAFMGMRIIAFIVAVVAVIAMANQNDITIKSVQGPSNALAQASVGRIACLLPESIDLNPWPSLSARTVGR